MPLPVLKSVESVRDLDEAFVYIALDNPDAALAFLNAVKESYRMLGQEPMIGSLRRFEQTKLEGVRIWRVKKFEKYLIIYTIEAETVKILRVLDSRRDFNLLLDL